MSMIRTLLAATALTAAAVTLTPAGASANQPQPLAGRSSVAVSALASVKPVEQRLSRLPSGALAPLEAIGAPAPAPLGKGGRAGSLPATAPNDVTAPTGGAAASGIAPQNYGLNNLNTIYHYTDSLIPASVVGAFPNRPVGWFVFTTNTGGTFRCTASLISRSILVTAGHCVHNGGGGQANYIRSGTFYPAYNGGASTTYGSATAAYVYTTGGWAGTGALDRGYDVGLVVLNKRTGTSTEIGNATGWLGFCHTNCLQPQWYNTQIGYPGNYYSGQFSTQGQHHQRSDGFDYVYGSGMEGGSSGGPHITNLGSISDTSTNFGQYTSRNQVFAVTSWGYTDTRLKIQGASPLSGPNNGNNFRAMYNTMCNLARGLHGVGSCSLL